MARNLVFMVLDSCRYDSFTRACTPHFDPIWRGGTALVLRVVDRALWIILPDGVWCLHQSPQGVYASEAHKEHSSVWMGLPRHPRPWLPELHPNNRRP